MIEALQSRLAGYPNLDRLPSRRRLARYVANHSGAFTHYGTHALGDCLMANSPICASILSCLDHNISALNSQGAFRRSQLWAKLCDDQQFINTLSELSLGCWFASLAWSTTADVKFFGMKNADWRVQRDNIERFVDVTNLGVRVLEQSPDFPGSGARTVDAVTDQDLMVRKIIEKYHQKFGPAHRAGWRGRAWVALDYSKNQSEALDDFIRDIFLPDWPRFVAKAVASECPDLEGIILYSYYPTYLLPHDIKDVMNRT